MPPRTATGNVKGRLGGAAAASEGDNEAPPSWFATAYAQIAQTQELRLLGLFRAEMAASLMPAETSAAPGLVASRHGLS
jgi:hypothetical protein